MIPQASIWPALHDAADNKVFHLVNAGVPGPTTAVGVAGKGCFCTDTLTGSVYINKGTALAPSWQIVSGTLEFDSFSYSTIFQDGLGAPLTDNIPSVTLPGSGVRVFGNGISANDSGVVVTIDDNGPVAVMQTSAAAGQTIALGAGLSGSLPFRPAINGPIGVTAVVAMIGALTNRKFFLGFVGAAIDAILTPATAVAANINISQANMAGIFMDSGAIDPIGLYTPSNKLNATPVVLGSLIATPEDFPPALTYTRLTVIVEKDGTVTMSKDGLVIKTLPQALDPMTPIAPLLLLANSSAGTKQMAVKFFSTFGNRG